jgi:phospholipid/cholesterol/gamma-HCH transport system permease protein
MALLSLLEQIGHYCHFAARALPAALLAVRRPAELLRQLHSILLGALPLAGVTGLALGVVVWLHLHGVIEKHLVRKVPEYLALAVVLEFAPLGAGLIVAGRSGASLGAELGSMRLTEQIDALEVLGRSPMEQLVGPRVLACMLTLPILTVYVAVLSIGSSFLSEMLGGSLSWTQYWDDCLRSLSPGKMIPATLKTVVFGYLVAVTGCWCGMTAEGGTEGVGRAATRGVVVSIFVVMVANVFLVKLIQVCTGSA